MWPKGAMYPSEWTESFESYLIHKDKLVELIKKILAAYNEETMTTMIYEARKVSEAVGEKYFNGAALYQTIIDSQI